METPKSLDDALNQALQLLRGLSPKHRLYLFGGAALVGLTLWLFVGLLGKPKLTTLYSGLKPADAQALGSRLAAKNIYYELSPDGATLMVAAEQVDAARLETASQGLPRNARLGFELFDTPNWTGSDFTEKVNYQRALEGELERTLQTLSEVEAVRVHLVLPRESLFTEEERAAKAAVILKTHGGGLSEQEQAAIPALVASAVDGLSPENVTVVDADSNLPLRGYRGKNGQRASSDIEQNLEKTLVRTLEPVVGAEHVRASVHVDYDASTSENTDEIYDPNKTATLSQQKSEETMGGGLPAGVPGTASNLPGATGGKVTATANDSQSSRSESATFAVSKSIRHTMRPAGDIKRISAALLVDDAMDGPAAADGKPGRRKRTPEELKQIEVLAGAAIGLDTQRGDLISVQNLSFQEAPPEKITAPSRLERTRSLLMQWSGLLRYAGILALFLVVYFLIFRPVKTQLITAFRELPVHITRATPTPAVTAAVEIELPPGTDQARRAAVLKKQLADKVRTEPEAASRLVQGWIREAAKP